MTWTKLSDGFAEETLDLSDAAFRLHVAATAYSNRVGSDGRIPKARLSLVPVPARARRRSVVRELVDAHLWDERDDAYELVDFFRAQLSAEEVELRRLYDAARQAIRFSKSRDMTPENRALLREREVVTRDALLEARERRRARATDPEGDFSQSESQRPAPTRIRPGPSRSLQERGRGRGPERPDAPLGGAPVAEGPDYSAPDPWGHLRSVDPLDRPSPWNDPANRCAGCDKPFQIPNDMRVARVLAGQTREYHQGCAEGFDRELERRPLNAEEIAAIRETIDIAAGDA